MDPLTELGRVDPPAAEVLDNAREALWSVVAAEAIPTAEAPAAEAPAAEAPARNSAQEHLHGKRQMPN